jgi:hypothetical protein
MGDEPLVYFIGYPKSYHTNDRQDDASGCPSCLVKGPVQQNPKYAVFQSMQKFITHAKQKRRKMLAGM